MSVNGYGAFLARKEWTVGDAGVAGKEPHRKLYQFQRDLVRWALRKGRAALFCDTGLGKTLMQVDWARLSGAKACLILAPLGVVPQTIREAEKIGVEIRRVKHEKDHGEGIMISNYDRAGEFSRWDLGALVLDESSILKSLDGATKSALIRDYAHVPMRLCCTATPAPNDVTEMANHAEFLGVAKRGEMLARFFVHDTDDSGQNRWRLKGHAEEAFWKWMAGWASFVRAPSDLGYKDDGFILPPLTVEEEVVRCEWTPEGELFSTSAGGVRGFLAERKATVAQRVEAVCRLARGKGQWLIWCGLNDEQEAVTAGIGKDAVAVSGSDDEASRNRKVEEWQNGKTRVLVTKPSMMSFGMNFQHCHQMLFVGLDYSFERYYQAVRRCWRHGQTKPVKAIVVVSQGGAGVAAVVRRKEREHADMARRVAALVMKTQINEIAGVTTQEEQMPEQRERRGDGWEMRMGDSMERITEIGDASIGLSVFSPPFASLYTYSDSARDVGNARDYQEFFDHMSHLIPGLLRVTIPGRRAAVHVQQVAMLKSRDGVIGWYDFRADMVAAFRKYGWVYDGEVVIDKDSQAQAIRTKSKQLMFVQKERDAAWLRPAMADYILLFRAPGDNPQPVKSDVTNDEWISWARPIWYGIDETDTLNYRAGREDKDERHICPLQLDTIRRCVRLWSNPGDIVLDPFAGIGSTVWVAHEQGRRGLGIELKKSYWEQACRNLDAAARQMMIPEREDGSPLDMTPAAEVDRDPFRCAIGRRRPVGEERVD